MPTLSHLLLIGKIISVIFSVSYTRLRLALRSLTHHLTYRLSNLPSSPSSSSEPLNIVIIGASFAGYHAAKCLANSVPSGHRVVVVERNSHFQFTWVFPRFCVIRGGGHERKAFVPYGPYVGGGLERGSCVWVRDSVEKIEEEKNDNKDDDGKDEEKGGYVVLRSGEKIKYEYLVVATGSAAELPSRVGKEDKADGLQLFRDMQDRIEAAKDVVVLGGGPAGVELAADAKALYPGKNVTLLHSRTRLMNGSFGPKMHEVAVKELEKLGVDLVLGERAQLPADRETEAVGEVVLNSGKRIPCDCLIKCIGQKPNSSLIAELSPSSITESGHIKVLPTLQIVDEAHRNIYAIGDVADTGSIKNGRAAIEQAQFVAENIVRAIKGKKPVEYHPQWFEGFTELTLGLDKSVMYFNDGSAEIILPHRNKDVALRSDQCWRLFGVKPFEDPSDLEAAKA